MASLRCQNYFAYNQLGLTRVLLQKVIEHFSHSSINSTHYIGIAKFGFGLPLKLWFSNFHRNNSRHPFTKVIAIDFDFYFIKLS